MSPRKPNAAAMRRERARLLAERETSTNPLPEEFVTWLKTKYQPKPELQLVWPRVLPFVRTALEGSRIRGTDSLRKHVTHLAHFGAWADERALPLDPKSLLTRVNTDEYCRVGMHGSTEKSCSDRRSKLRALADQVNPEQAPAKTKSIPRPALKPPYTDKDMQAVRRVVYVQPTAELTRSLCVCVGLGAGAGIDSPDLKLLIREHVEDLAEQGIRVTVPGANGRTVWVLREYEDMVRRGLVGLAPSDLLIGREPGRHNVAGEVFGRAKLYGDLPNLEQSRLRTTWLATLMARPVPLAVLCRAAGLKSTRTLFDLLPHLPHEADKDALREGGAR